MARARRAGELTRAEAEGGLMTVAPALTARRRNGERAPADRDRRGNVGLIHQANFFIG